MNKMAGNKVITKSWHGSSRYCSEAPAQMGAKWGYSKMMFCETEGGSPNAAHGTIICSGSRNVRCSISQMQVACGR